MLRDSQGFETQIIDAVRSVNRALGGATGSTALRRSDYNHYEVQLIDAIRGIGRTLSGKGLTLAGGVAGDMSGYATVEQFNDLSRRVTKLEDESFFRLVDGNVTLKSGYSNLWVPGWLAAGGVGTGGGGGGIVEHLSDIGDVSISNLLDGQGIIWDGTNNVWKNATIGGGGGGSTISISQSTSSGVQTTTFLVDGVSTSIAVKTVAFGTQASDKIPITIGSTTKNVLTAHQSLSGYVPTSRQVNGHALTSDVTVTKGDLGLGNVENTKLSTWAGSQNITTLGTITTGVWNGTAIGVTKGGTGLASISKGAMLYGSASNVISALAPNGTTTKKFLSQTGDNAPAWGTLSTSDITDINSWINGFGFALASDLAGYVTIAGGQTITGAKTFSAWLTASGGIITGGDIYPSTDLGGSLGYSTRRFSGLNVREISTGGINFKSSDNSATTGYLSFQAGYMILRSGSNIGSSYKQLTFHESYGFYPDGTGVNLGYSGANNRWATIYGVNADLTGDLSLASTSHIDIGPLRIEYDATHKALHITKVSSSDNNTYGLYADGFVAAAGIGQIS